MIQNRLINKSRLSDYFATAQVCFLDMRSKCQIYNSDINYRCILKVDCHEHHVVFGMFIVTGSWSDQSTRHWVITL